MAEWWLATNAGVTGPHDTQTVKELIQADPFSWVWLNGKTVWRPSQKIRAVQAVDGNGVAIPVTDTSKMAPRPDAPPPGADLPPGFDAGISRGDRDLEVETASAGFGGAGVTEGIDFRIVGNEMQFVEIELDPGESAIAEAGGMMFKTPTIEMQTIFGDGSNQDEGFMSKAFGAAKRVLTGESLFMTVFTHEGGAGKAHVAFGAPYPGNIVAVNLEELGEELIAQKDSFLAASKGVSVDLHFQRKVLTALFGGEGFIMQKLTGNGWAFLHAGGSVIRKDLKAGEELHIDTGCVVGYTGSCNFEIMQTGGVKTMLFGGEGLFFAKLSGPGTVWLQSLPFSRLARRMFAAAPQGGNRDKGEGSVLGNIGGLLDGDNSF
ncbi:MAG: AIM24 family protein [Alphaproteobacteria bacterium]|nr:AIM24 family protein [Alphaproteobacteria bacterium SS10]